MGGKVTKLVCVGKTNGNKDASTITHTNGTHNQHTESSGKLASSSNQSLIHKDI